jgi:hypothetical protein
MALDTWVVIASGLGVAVLVLILGGLAVVCLLPGGGPKARAKREDARTRRREASDQREELRAERGKARARREEKARKARN